MTFCLDQNSTTFGKEANVIGELHNGSQFASFCNGRSGGGRLSRRGNFRRERSYDVRRHSSGGCRTRNVRCSDARCLIVESRSGES